jgi:hypothetical protein
MPRGRSRFTQADVTRAIKAVLGAGLPVTGIRLDADGFTVLTGQSHPIAGRTSEAKNALDAAMAHLQTVYGPGEDEELADASRVDAPQRHRPIPGQSDPIQKYYDEIGFDPETMNDSDLARLQQVAEERWRASIPGSALNKRERTALLQFQHRQVTKTSKGSAPKRGNGWRFAASLKFVIVRAHGIASKATFSPMQERSHCKSWKEDCRDR